MEVNLPQELAAEVQISVSRIADQIAQRLRQIDSAGRELREANLVRKGLPSSDPFHGTVAAIAVMHISIPAFGGLLYAIAGIGLVCRHNGNEFSVEKHFARVETGDMDYVKAALRLRWRELKMTYGLMDEILSSSEGLFAVLLRGALIVDRAETDAAGGAGLGLEEEWHQLSDQLGEFWNHAGQLVYPFTDSGPVIVAIEPGGPSRLIHVLNCFGPEVLPDKIPPIAASRLAGISSLSRQVGTGRLWDRILVPGERTAAYPPALNADVRLQPTELLQQGVIEFSIKCLQATKTWTIQSAGGHGDWTSAKLDTVSRYLQLATVYNQAEALPLPLWFAGRTVAIPPNVLGYLKTSVGSALNSIRSGKK